MRRSAIQVTTVALACALLFRLGATARAQKHDPAHEAKIAKLRTQMVAEQTKSRFFGARRVAGKIYKLELKKKGAAHPTVAIARSTYAGLMTTTGDYYGAQKLYERALQIAESQHGPTSVQTAQALDALASNFWVQQNFAAAEPLFTRSLSIYRAKYGEKSTMFAAMLQRSAGLLSTQHQYAAAEALYERARSIYIAVEGPSSTSALGIDMAIVYPMWRRGRHKAAIKILDRTVAKYKKDYAGKSDMLAMMLYGPAAYYKMVGAKRKANKLFDIVAAHYRKQLASATPSAKDYKYRMSLSQLASLAQQREKWTEAARYYEKLMDYDKRVSKNKLTMGTSALSLAMVRQKQKKYKEAVRLLKIAEKSYARTLSGYTASTPLMLRSELERERGNWSVAAKLSQKVYKAARKQYGVVNNPIVNMMRERYGVMLMGGGKYKRALAEIGAALTDDRKNLRLILSAGTEDDNRAFLGDRVHHMPLAITLHYKHLPKDKRAAKLGLETVLVYKGRLLDGSAGSVSALRRQLTKKDRAMLDQLTAARAQLSKLVLAGPDAAGGEAAYAKQISEFESKIRALEAKVRKRSAAFRATEQPIDMRSVQKAIPKGAALVELIAFKPFDPQASVAAKSSTKRYGAYVLRPKGAPTFVDLGLASRIDPLIEKLREELSTADGDDYKSAGKALYRRAFLPLEKQLKGVKNVLIAPDGNLNLVPYAAMVDNAGKFLVQRFSFNYLTSGRDLLRFKVKVAPKTGVVIIADPAFDNAAAGKPKKGQSRGRRSRSLRSIKWNKLPGTAEEARAIAKTWKKTVLLSGRAATETALKNVRAPRILHLATHGFFLPGEDEPEPAEIAGMQGPQGAPIGGAKAASGGENPLLRSGLALAGANKLVSGSEDGVLTALEASGLNLWGTQLVVMSACETGVGKVKDGEGVYGLRRALVIAGAESLLMSLWQVDDEATRDLMTGYYKRLKRGKGRTEALRLIQLKMLSDPDTRHPFYWASFIPSGHWTPLPR